ncbi:MAG: hypothetical protein MI685_01780 [Chlorobiales bacterium]|nr:hypothetical protein [Chlorobiales bacterium]
MEEFVSSVCTSGCRIQNAQLLLVGFNGYTLDNEISQLTEENAAKLKSIFSQLGECQTITIEGSSDGENELSAGTALRLGTKKVLDEVTDHTDIVLDVSSVPRVVYLSLLTGLLNKLVPNKEVVDGVSPLTANGVNFQVIVGEDAALDGHIQAEDPSKELVLIPGFSSAFHAESIQDWPMVWFPILGEGRANQLQRVMSSAIIPNTAEICPVLPHPSRNPRRADNLLVEYKVPLFDSRQTPMSNILYAHESNPFETYRQLLGAMQRYRHSMTMMGGCRLVITPLGSKLITLGAGLACFEMQPSSLNKKFGVAIPHAEPTRYSASVDVLKKSRPDISVMLLTGDAYSSV